MAFPRGAKPASLTNNKLNKNLLKRGNACAYSVDRSPVCYSRRPSRWQAASARQLPLIPQFRSLTGINVEYLILPEAEYFTKLVADPSQQRGEFSVIMTGPVRNWDLDNEGLQDLLIATRGLPARPSSKAHRRTPSRPRRRR